MKATKNARGRKAVDGAKDLIQTNVAITQKVRAVLARIGDGNMSLGVRRMAKFVSADKGRLAQIRAAID